MSHLPAALRRSRFLLCLPVVVTLFSLLVSHVAAQDERDEFEPLLYVAQSIDTFMADDFATYLNPDDADGSRGRVTAGAQADFRFPGIAPDDPVQLWVLADTTYGVRSSDVDCAETDPNKQLAICKDLDPNTASEVFQYVIREATSLEGGLGLRLELGIGKDWKQARAYAIGRTSFVAVSEQPDDFLEISHYGLGILAPGGDYMDSYLEVGRVKNELFLPSGSARWRVDGRLNIPVSLKDKTPFGSFFLRTTVEFDRGDGPDSALTSTGFAFNLDKLSGG